MCSCALVWVKPGTKSNLKLFLSGVALLPQWYKVTVLLLLFFYISFSLFLPGVEKWDYKGHPFVQGYGGPWVPLDPLSILPCFLNFKIRDELGSLFSWWRESSRPVAWPLAVMAPPAGVPHVAPAAWLLWGIIRMHSKAIKSKLFFIFF